MCYWGGGAVLTKSTRPYGIYVGVPGRRVSERFKNKELEEHINILQEKYKW
mgnify:CR=1 FL=1